jgi:hypothetical protein
VAVTVMVRGGLAVDKIRSGLVVSGFVLLVVEWLLVSHAVSWLTSGVLPK